MVYRKKYVSGWSQLTKIVCYNIFYMHSIAIFLAQRSVPPQRLRFHSNVHPFTSIQSTRPSLLSLVSIFILFICIFLIFKLPSYFSHVETGHEIVAIECLPEKESDDSVTAALVSFHFVTGIYLFFFNKWALLFS